MQINLITPAKENSHSGNRVTANRWSELLHTLGHRVNVMTEYSEYPCDCLIAVHAYRSAQAIATFKKQYPKKPLIVLLAGTDVYRFQHSHREQTLASMQSASILIGLHDLVGEDIPHDMREKLKIIHQSATPLDMPRAPSHDSFDVCVVGHLRAEKDPLRTALAARRLPKDSKIRVIHLGKAHDDVWAETARAEMAANPRYEWRGDVTPNAVQQCFATSHAMAITSVMEGGANVVSEAIVADLPVLASRIAGNVGLLGHDHPAYYEAQNTSELSALLKAIEREPEFLKELTTYGRTRAHLFSRDREREKWRGVLDNC